jgi:hypothetical protein
MLEPLHASMQGLLCRRATSRGSYSYLHVVQMHACHVHAGAMCITTRVTSILQECIGRLFRAALCSFAFRALVSSCSAVCPLCLLPRWLVYVRHVRTLDPKNKTKTVSCWQGSDRAQYKT